MIAERGRYDMTDKERRAFMRKFIDSGELRIRSDRTNTLEKMIADQMQWKFIFLEKLFIYHILPRKFPIQLSLFWKIFFLECHHHQLDRKWLESHPLSKFFVWVTISEYLKNDCFLGLKERLTNLFIYSETFFAYHKKYQAHRFY